MPYTLWSRGRLLGETELAYRRWKPCFRAGDFAPNEAGEKLMPIIVGVGPALHALYDRHAEDLRRQRAETESDAQDDGYPEEVRRSTEYADAVSIADELESLALELRDPSGAVVDTEEIWLNDTYRLIAIGREAMRREDPDFEFDEPEPWETPPPQYQIMVALRGYDESMRGGMRLDLDPELEAELKARAGEQFDGQFDYGFAEDLDEWLDDESDEELGESDEMPEDG